ncbi:DUF4240 domain-containing protein [Actinomadura adrarensis]|uniref:DUF4240 domain-containing protein n=1 Tax=Actinomadura adrarensis TaxID=1819600 RepID=A0ABW3CPZ1_9ACTN
MSGRGTYRILHFFTGDEVIRPIGPAARWSCPAARPRRGKCRTRGLRSPHDRGRLLGARRRVPRRRRCGLCPPGPITTRRLQALPLDEPVDFGTLWEETAERACTWPVWDVAALLLGGCGDDSLSTSEPGSSARGTRSSSVW